MNGIFFRDQQIDPCIILDPRDQQVDQQIDTCTYKQKLLLYYHSHSLRRGQGHAGLEMMELRQMIKRIRLTLFHPNLKDWSNIHIQSYRL